jgi:hypothetical protein
LASQAALFKLVKWAGRAEAALIGVAACPARLRPERPRLIS